MLHRYRQVKILMLFSVLFLCGCVIKSEKEIIKNDQSTLMFKGAKNLIWITHDDQQIMLERLKGKFDRTYLGRSLEDLSEIVMVRFYKWPEENLIPGEDLYIVSGYLEEKGSKAYYYQLLTHDSSSEKWTTWAYNSPDNKEVKVENFDQLLHTFRKMIEDKHFIRQELITFKSAIMWDNAKTLKKKK